MGTEACGQLSTIEKGVLMSIVFKVKRFITHQTPSVSLGMFRQLFGGASTWVTLLVLGFTGIAAWDAPIMQSVRSWLPWLSFWFFVLITISAIFFAMWTEHKWTQPGIIVYWNNMWWEHGNAMRTHLERMDKRDEVLAQILVSLIPEGEQRDKARALLDDCKSEK